MINKDKMRTEMREYYNKYITNNFLSQSRPTNECKKEIKVVILNIIFIVEKKNLLTQRNTTDQSNLNKLIF
jgi:hypothetical protein